MTQPVITTRLPREDKDGTFADSVSVRGRSDNRQKLPDVTLV